MNPSKKEFARCGWVESSKLFIFKFCFFCNSLKFCIPFIPCFQLSRSLSHSLHTMYLPWELPDSWAVRIGFFRFFHESQTSYVASISENFKNWSNVLVVSFYSFLLKTWFWYPKFYVLLYSDLLNFKFSF